MLIKNILIPFKPPKKDAHSLADRLKREKDMECLSRLVKENNIGVLTVHPFYARFWNEETGFRHAGRLKDEYFKYEKDAVEFQSALAALPGVSAERAKDRVTVTKGGPAIPAEGAGAPGSADPAASPRRP